MKKIFLSALLIPFLILSGCSSSTTNNEEDYISKKYVEDNAKEDLSKEEVTKIFGEPREKEVNSDKDYEIWLYDSGEKNGKYKPDFESVAFESILNGDISYQFIVVISKDKAVSFSYFYKKDNNVWEYKTTGDKESASTEKSTTFDEE